MMLADRGLIDLRAVDDAGRGLLDWRAWNYDPALFSWLLDRIPTWNVKDSHGQTIPMILVQNDGCKGELSMATDEANKACRRALKDHLARIFKKYPDLLNASDKKGHTVLFFAFYHPDRLEDLLALGASPSVSNSQGLSLLQEARQLEATQAARLLERALTGPRAPK